MGSHLHRISSSRVKFLVQTKGNTSFQSTTCTKTHNWNDVTSNEGNNFTLVASVFDLWFHTIPSIFSLIFLYLFFTSDFSRIWNSKEPKSIQNKGTSMTKSGKKGLSSCQAVASKILRNREFVCHSIENRLDRLLAQFIEHRNCGKLMDFLKPFVVFPPFIVRTEWRGEPFAYEQAFE